MAYCTALWALVCRLIKAENDWREVGRPL